MSDSLDKEHLSQSRRISESQAFRSEFKALLAKHPILKELFIAIKHELQSYAHINPNAEQGYYWIDTKPLSGIPVFSVMYTFDSSAVYLQAIIIVPEDQL